jgi:predicted RNase H-like nuclease (RuvC/YqgF family)
MINILFTWRRLQKQVEELKKDNASLVYDLTAEGCRIEAYQRELETVRLELENMTRERDEWHEALQDCGECLLKNESQCEQLKDDLRIEEIRSADWQGKYQRLESAMKSAFGIRS